MNRITQLKFLCCITLFFFALSFALYCNFTTCLSDRNSVAVFASEETDNPEITILDIGDKLYQELIFQRDGEYPENISDIEIPLRQNDFINLTTLNLSDRYLEYIGGLAYFKFDNLKELNLSNNNLIKIPAQTFYNITSLTTLNISNNEITEFQFGNLSSVQNFYAEFNNLTEIDFSNISNVDTTTGYVNLAQNKFTTMENIGLPNAESPKYFELFGNQIADASANPISYLPHQLNFIIQGLKQDSEIDDKTKIVIYPSYNEHIYKVKFTNITTTTEKVFEAGDHLLDVGKYKIEIYDNETNLSTQSLQNNIYTGFEFVVIKSAPTVEAYIDGKLIDYKTKINKPVTLKFDSGDENYVIKYSINGNEYIIGNQVTLNKQGNYTILVKSVNGDNVSKTLSIGVVVEIQEDNFLTILIIILSIAALGTGGILLKSWLKN